MARMTKGVPVVSAENTEATGAWYRDHLGFEVVHNEPGWTIVERDGIGVHFQEPRREAFRIRVEGIDELYEQCLAENIVHPNAPLEEKPWGARQFGVVEGDGNQLTYFER